MKRRTGIAGGLIAALIAGAGMPFLCPAPSALAAPASPQADAAKQQYEQGAKLYQQGDYEGALQALKKAVELQPRSAETHYLLGMAYYNGKKQPAEAIGEIKKAIQLNPQFGQAYYDLGLIYQAQDKPTDAEQALTRAVELAPNEQSHLALARLHERNRNTSQAIRAYLALLAIKPEHAGALYSLGYLYDSQKDSRRAREMLQRLLKVVPTHADGWYLLGRIAEKENRLTDAASAYRQAIAAKPDLVDAHYNLGFLYRSLNRQDEAAKQFQEVIRLKPEYAEAHMNLGVVYTGLNKLDEAEKEYEAAVELKPKLAEAHYNFGIFYELHKKDAGKALAQYRKYLELGGKDERVERIVGQVK
jgi:tetratricopeptide (TPR) repeat protein